MSAELRALARAIGQSQPLYRGENSIRRGWRRASVDLLAETFLGMCETLEIRGLIECGAHGAEVSMRFVELTGGSAIAVEANPHTFDLKTSAAHSENVTALNVGLGARPGVADFHVPNPSRSLVRGTASFLRRDELTEYETFTVEVKTLDEVATGLNEMERVALWVDVEGFTGDVLAGGTELLSSGLCHLIMVEVESRPVWQGQTLGYEIDGLLQDYGFVPLLRDAQLENQYNLIYVRAESALTVDGIVVAFWSRLGNLKSRRDPYVRLWLGRAKARLVGQSGTRRARIIHEVASRLGSNSSRRSLGR